MAIVQEYLRKVQVGERYGRWIVLGAEFIVRVKATGKPFRRRMAVCVCDCGEIACVGTDSLVDASSRSCGCLSREVSQLLGRSRAGVKHPSYKNGYSTCRIGRIWYAMRQRCENEKNQDYPRYGGRGITVCSEWSSFEAFKSWAEDSGYNDSLTIDRQNVNEGYSPTNCRWTDAVTQSRNKEIRLEVEAFGESKLICEWAEDTRCVVSHRTLRARISDYGWSAETAISTPNTTPKQREAFGELKSLAEWVADSRCQVSERVLLKRHVVRGWSLEEAITTPPGKRRAKKP